MLTRTSARVALGILALAFFSVLICILFTPGARSAKTPGSVLVADLVAQRPFYCSVIYHKPLRFIVPPSWFRKADLASFEIEQRRQTAARKLGEMKTNAWPYLPALLAAVDHKDISIGYPAAWTLVSIEADRHPQWQDFQKALVGRTNAARVFEYLLTGSDYRHGGGIRHDVACRRFGILGLAATGPAIPTAPRAIIEVIKSGDEPHELRAVAVVALGQMRTKDSATVNLLGQILLDAQEWPDVRGSAALALVRASPDSPDTRVLLRQALLDDHALVRLGAVRGLWTLGVPAPELLPTLAALLEHKLVTVRVGALGAISDLGSAALPLRAGVERLIGEDDARLRSAAVLALQRISSSPLPAPLDHP